MKILKSVLRPIRIAAEYPQQILFRAQDSVKRMRCRAAKSSKLHKSCRIINSQGDRDNISIGESSHIHGDLLILKHGGSIQIGKYSFVSEGTRIWSGKEVHIGDRVLVSHSVNIHDTDSHSLSASERHAHFASIISSGHPAVLNGVAESPVRIEDDAWIGFGSAIFKGVTVGKGAVVAAMSVVTKDVPPYTIVAGNPARPIGVSRQ